MQGIKNGDDDAIVAETEVKAEVLTPTSAKREAEEDQKPLIAFTKVAARQVKRRRKR